MEGVARCGAWFSAGARVIRHASDMPSCSIWMIVRCYPAPGRHAGTVPRARDLRRFVAPVWLPGSEIDVYENVNCW